MNFIKKSIEKNEFSFLRREKRWFLGDFFLESWIHIIYSLVRGSKRSEGIKEAKKEKEKWGREIEWGTMRVVYVGQKGCCRDQ